MLIETAPGPGFVAQLRLAAAKARILGVAGGDGTVSTASAVALDHGLPLVVIPAGTFNHFAADLGIRSAHDAVTAPTNGEAVLVDVAIAGNRPFVNTSSTGIYVDLVRAREQLECVLGKGPAALIGLIQVLRRARPHELILDGRRRRLWLYFAGNCRYEPPGTAPAYRPDLRRLPRHPCHRRRAAGQVSADCGHRNGHTRPLPGLPLVAGQVGRCRFGGRPADLAVRRWRGGNR